MRDRLPASFVNAGAWPVPENDKFKDYARYADTCLKIVAVTTDQELRRIQREMAAEWLRLADAIRRPRRFKQMQMEWCRPPKFSEEQLMPRYYFHVRWPGRKEDDPTGMWLADDPTARDYAEQLINEMKEGEGHDPNLTMVVERAGTVLFTL
jgi:hypothetical protein